MIFSLPRVDGPVGTVLRHMVVMWMTGASRWSCGAAQGDPDTIIVARIFVGRRLRSWPLCLGRRRGTIVPPDLCSRGEWLTVPRLTRLKFPGLCSCGLESNMTEWSRWTS